LKSHGAASEDFTYEKRTLSDYSLPHPLSQPMQTEFEEASHDLSGWIFIFE
jgi:hypothetical protein